MLPSAGSTSSPRSPKKKSGWPSKRARAPAAPTGSTCGTSWRARHHQHRRAAPGRPRAVIAWEPYSAKGARARSTIRRRLSALSACSSTWSTRGASESGGRVARPAINREEGTTLAFSKVQARKLLDTPPADTIAGLRDRAILSVGLQVGLRRAEIAALKVGDLHQNRGYNSLRVTRKGGRRDALAINPQTAPRLRAYLERAGHAGDIDGPLFRPLRHNGKQAIRRPHGPGRHRPRRAQICGALGLARGYSAHSMRATFITTALENGAQLEDVQKAAGHRDPSTTKLYDRRGYNPEKAASFFATY